MIYIYIYIFRDTASRVCDMGDEEKSRVMMATCYSIENPQIYNLTSAPMDIVGFPIKNNHINEFTINHQTVMLSPPSWNHHHNRLVVEDPSLRCAVFSGGANQSQTQGSLSLSLTSSDPSNTNPQSARNNDSRFGQSSSMSANQRHVMQQQFQIRDSKYLEPAKELLNQLCNLGTAASKMKAKVKSSESQRQDESGAVGAQPPLFALELQRRKAKLFQMLQEVEGRYKQYCDHMKAVVASFEAVAGDGAAAAYSLMASREMSRLFRRLKDAIVSQMKAMGEKDAASCIPGATKGETPRLRILDVKLRQQRAFQQMGMAENHPWRPQRGLPEKAVAVLRAWLFEHFLHPYPSEVDKRILARQTGLSRSQVSNWFINARVRLWKPMVEEMYMEDQREEEDADGSNSHNPKTNEDRKPTQDQLTVRTDSECLSTIINTPAKNTSTRGGDDMQFDFSSYTYHGHGGAAAVSYGTAPSNYGGGGVSLTLGLQQHHGGLGFAPAAASGSSLFYPRDEMEECQTVEYSIFESENQNMHYRNLMGAQLLHDLAG